MTDRQFTLGMTVGGRIRERRQSQKLTIAALSSLTNISTSFLSEVEKSAELSVSRLGRIAQALGVSVGELVDGASPSMPGEQHWAVTVYRNGEQLVTIESNWLSGRDLSDEDELVIRMAADHLHAFVGSSREADNG